MNTPVQEFVTHEELDTWGGEIMRQLDVVRGDIQDIRENMLTKQEALDTFLTKEDAQRIFLTKEDAEQFATKEDLKQLATKEEVERLFLVLDEIRENTKK